MSADPVPSTSSTIEARRFIPVHRLSFEEAGLIGASVHKTDRIVIPAHNEAGSIGTTLGYLIEVGFAARQIIVLVNHTEDNTAEVASRFGVTVVEQNEMLTDEVKSRLEGEYGVHPDRLRGKGTAMFAAGLVLARENLPDDARIFFIDADITNPGEVDPIGLLLAGWEVWNGDVRIIKLASENRHNEGIHAFLSLPRVPYFGIGALRWPLCGQMVLRWGDLRKMRGANSYAIEMAMLMCLWDDHDTPSIFGEVSLGVELKDKHNDDQRHARMFWGIEGYMTQLLLPGGWRRLRSLKKDEVRSLNEASVMPTPVWMPPKGDGSCVLEMLQIDAIMPSVTEFLTVTP